MSNVLESMSAPSRANARSASIWWFALGYFACYAPYSALTKAVTSGLVAGGAAHVDGFKLLPVTAIVSAIGMLAFLTTARWWQYASHATVAGVRVPRPTRWTLLSGVCTAGIIATTTLAYTFEGVSIVFVMLLMRGGVLLIAPVVDALTGRAVRWFSAAGSALSLGALVVAFSERGGYEITLVCGVDVALYLACYFIRFRFMTELAKRDDPAVNKRYFVEEQMVASPVLVVTLAVAAAVGQGEGGILAALRAGFTDLWTSPALPYALAIGLLSQGTGVFGSLIFLDHRENTYCVPVNRSSSILAGVLAAYGLTWFAAMPAPSGHQLIGAALIIGAIGFLSIPPLLGRRRRGRAPDRARGVHTLRVADRCAKTPRVVSRSDANRPAGAGTSNAVLPRDDHH